MSATLTNTNQDFVYSFCGAVSGALVRASDASEIRSKLGDVGFLRQERGSQ